MNSEILNNDWRGLCAKSTSASLYRMNETGGNRNDTLMEDKMKIHLLIDKERYPLTIRREEEQLYRDAAKQIDNKLNKYRRAYPEFSTVKHWAMAALELAFENMSMKDRNDTQPYVDKLKQLEEDIDKYIEKDKSGTV